MGTMFDSYPFTSADAESDRFKRILAWLVGQGAPEGKLGTEVANIPGHEPVTEYIVTFSKNELTYRINAGLLLRAPSVAITDLEVLFRFGNPDEASFFDYVRETPDPLPGTTPVGQPDNPIGKQIEGDPDSFYVVPGDQMPNGTIYRAADGSRYIKRTRFMLGGLVSMWWDKVA